MCTPPSMATQKFNEATGKMTQLCRRIVHVNIRWSVIEKATVFRQFMRLIWDRILECSVRMPHPHYRRLFPTTNSSSPPSLEAMDSGAGTLEHPPTTSYESDADLVSLKITILGDSQIGKTSFLVILNQLPSLSLSQVLI